MELGLGKYIGIIGVTTHLCFGYVERSGEHWVSSIHRRIADSVLLGGCVSGFESDDLLIRSSR